MVIPAFDHSPDEGYCVILSLGDIPRAGREHGMAERSDALSSGLGRPSRGLYGSDLMVEVLRALGIRYIALNPGASYRGLHDSLVNFGHGELPEIILCTHEEIAVALANGYARVTGEPMASGLHNAVGLLHASSASL